MPILGRVGSNLVAWKDIVLSVCSHPPGGATRVHLNHGQCTACEDAGLLQVLLSQGLRPPLSHGFLF